MFELAFIKKYLTPQRKQLSVSIIAVMSVAVITLVVWLLVVFLSVTEGIEKNWIRKLTALNAPLRLQPTERYFSSYYYNVDRYSAASHYMSKTIGQKAISLLSNPYDPEFDEELPALMAKPEVDAAGNLKDPIKGAMDVLNELKSDIDGLTFQDIEMSGALLRLELLRQDAGSSYPVEMQSQLTNVSYLSSFPEKNPLLSELLLPPTVDDLNHLLFLKQRSQQEDPSLLAYSHIEKLKTRSNLWALPIDLLPEKVPFNTEVYLQNGTITHLLIPDHPVKATSAIVEKRGKRLFFRQEGKPEIPLEDGIPLFAQGNLEFDVKAFSKNLAFTIAGTLQQKGIEGTVGIDGLQIAKAHFDTTFDKAPALAPLWAFSSKDGVCPLPQSDSKTGVLIAKNFRDNGVRIGDSGYLAYSAPALSGTKELHIPIYIAGFYDPGVMSVGNKCILVPSRITQAINASDNPFTLDRSEANNIYVWFNQLNDAPKIKAAILQKLQEKGIEKYWKVQTFREYDFAKDLMQQFQSDKYLFTLIGMIILLVACTNIISLLVLLVSDKKKEIGILRAMGAKRRSIAAIFAFSGASLGLFSCLLGVFLAFITLKNIDHLVSFLSMLQGHEAFNAQFFGSSLPHEISPRALFFAAVATPLLALLAGLVPAIKAARLNPCETLRSE